jgi:hypothetical protein
MIKDGHIYINNCFLSTHIVLKSSVVAVILVGTGSITELQSLFVGREQIRHNMPNAISFQQCDY